MQSGVVSRGELRLNSGYSKESWGCKAKEQTEGVVGCKITNMRDFSGGPVVKTLRFHCRGHRFDPWSGN